MCLKQYNGRSYMGRKNTPKKSAQNGQNSVSSDAEKMREFCGPCTESTIKLGKFPECRRHIETTICLRGGEVTMRDIAKIMPEPCIKRERN